MVTPGYAMQNAAAKDSLIWFNNPFDLLTWAHPLLEFVLLSGSVLAFCHAFRHYKRTGSMALVFAWLAIIVHAIFWEIMVFNFEELDTFWHGEFSIMLYHNRLPFYIVFGYYPALFYHSMLLAQRMGFSHFKYGRVIEALMVGLFFEILYAACESVSPVLQFWKWNLEHMSSQPVWENIPASGYLWGLSYGFAYGLLSRWFFIDLSQKHNFGLLKNLGLVALMAPLIPLIAMVFIAPVNILTMGLHEDFLASVLIFIYFAAAAWIFYLAPRKIEKGKDRLLMVFPGVWLTFMVALYFYLYPSLFSASRGADFVRYSTESGNMLLGFAGILGTIYLIHSARLNQSGTSTAAQSNDVC